MGMNHSWEHPLVSSITPSAPSSGKWHENKQVILGSPPSKSNCYKIITLKSQTGASHGSLAKTPALNKYENDFYIQCNHYRNANIQGYFEFEMDVYYANQRSDLDNSCKVVLDCLQKVGAFPNDNKCVRLVVNKFLDASNPRIEFKIKPAIK